MQLEKSETTKELENKTLPQKIVKIAKKNSQKRVNEGKRTILLF